MSSFPADDIPEVVLSFREALEDLQRNDQYEIENLTMIAKEATEHAQAISQEVETHIRKTRPEYKLPGLYLLDSLVKHIGTPYTVYLGRNLYRTFFNAYTVVDGNTRRAMEELCRSWTRPAPESRDPRPVFPAEVTQPIDAALAKMRGIDQRPPSVSYRPQAAPSPGNYGSQGRHTPTTNQYGYPPPGQPFAPHHAGSTQTLPYQNHPPPQPQTHSPFPPHVAGAVRPPINSPQPMPQPPAQSGTPVSYVYNGPPPPTMSHQARLDKLRYDVRGLLESVQGHLASYPQDQEKLKLLSNLQSLRALLDTGSLSLTHIQSTEIVVANIARSLPPKSTATPPQAPPQALPQAPPQAPQQAPSQAPPVFDPAVIASILARGTPQPAPASTIPSTTHIPPVPAPPQFQGIYPPPAAGRPPSALPHLQPQSIPPVPSATGNLNLPQASLGILEQLRASGLLGATPVQSTPVQAPAAASILSQLMQPQAGARALNDAKLDAASLKMPRPHLIKQLYEDKADQCRQCGMRFPATDQGKKAKGVHIDWHFKTNTRVQDSSKYAVNRSWYMDEHDWTNYREELGGYSGIVTEGVKAETKSLSKDPKEKFVFVPTDARLVNVPCSICQEKFEQGWDEATQQPTWKDAVKVGNKYYHASCYAEVTRGAAATAPNVATERTANSSARSTPDPVLGKRRFDDFRLDAPAV